MQIDGRFGKIEPLRPISRVNSTYDVEQYADLLSEPY